MPREVVVVATSVNARSDLYAETGEEPAALEMMGQVFGSCIPAGPPGATTAPGVWAAGNVTDLASQVISAAASGFRAGAAINADLIAEDTARAVAFFRASRG